MQHENKDVTLETLQEIRSIMNRSGRFISLSGWSGIWAGVTALAGAGIAYTWMQQPEYRNVETMSRAAGVYITPPVFHFMMLGLAVFTVAFIGGFYFTYRKAKRTGQSMWNNASRQMLLSLFFPIFAGAVFSMTFIYYGCGIFVAPTCLAFYGFALISASRHSLSDIRYLGTLDVMLGCVNLFFPGLGLLFWAAGFGVLHILYGAIMWNKYDK